MANWKYKPMLLSEEKYMVPSDGPWFYEIKWDGFRTMAYIESGQVRLQSRRGADFTRRYPVVTAALLKAFPVQQCVLDGEIVALSKGQRPSLTALWTRQYRERDLQYIVFDVLEVDGQSLVEQPLRERRCRLEQLYQGSPHIELSLIHTDKKQLLKEVCRHNLEGIVAKRVDSIYLSGKRSTSWIKIKCKGYKHC